MQFITLWKEYTTPSHGLSKHPTVEVCFTLVMNLPQR